MTNSDSRKPALVRLTDSQRFELFGHMIIGRHENCDLVLDRESGASRKHARLTVRDEGVFITDLGSLNGTLVNGEEVLQQTRLKHGDRVVFDEDEFELVAPPAPAPPTVAAPDLHDSITQVPPISHALPASGVTAFDAHSLSGAGGQPANTPGTPFVPPDQTADALTHLVVLTGPATGAVVVFDPDRSPWSIGSAINSDLPMRAPGIAIRHALIVQEGTRFKLVDQGSKAGTRVDGRQIESVWLEGGDKITFADVECRFHQPAAGTSAEAGDALATTAADDSTQANVAAVPRSDHGSDRVSDCGSEREPEREHGQEPPRTAANDRLQEPSL